MPGSEDYVSLITSLPSAERLFLAKLTPLSRLKLEQRLSVLSDNHKKVLKQIESVLDWRMQNTDMSNIDFLQNAKKVYQTLRSPTLRTIVRERLERRTCIAALRHRAYGLTAPSSKAWGFGRWVDHINRNWHEPHFGLEHAFPWLLQAQQFISNKDPEGLERFILELAFTQLQRLSGQHYFDFEAVVIYVLKWDIVDRTTRYNVAAAKTRFNELVNQGLGDSADALFKVEQ